MHLKAVFIRKEKQECKRHSPRFQLETPILTWETTEAVKQNFCGLKENISSCDYYNVTIDGITHKPYHRMAKKKKS